MWYSQIEVSLGRSLKKAKGKEKEKKEKKKNKLFMAFRRKAKISLSVPDIGIWDQVGPILPIFSQKNSHVMVLSPVLNCCCIYGGYLDEVKPIQRAQDLVKIASANFFYPATRVYKGQ